MAFIYSETMQRDESKYAEACVFFLPLSKNDNSTCKSVHISSLNLKRSWSFRIDVCHIEGLYCSEISSLLQGVLIVGERGTGKTSLALAIAAEAKVPLVEVKARELEAGLWVGQSASNIRELFQTARDLVVHYTHLSISNSFSWSSLY